MKKTKTEICNFALITLGQNTITDFYQDNSKTAQLVRQVYDYAKKEILTGCAWDFCIRVKELEIAGDTMETDGLMYPYSYIIPADCLFVNCINKKNRLFKEPLSSDYRAPKLNFFTDDNNRRIVNCSFPDAWIKYTCDVSEELFPSDFSQALAYLIASKLAIPIANSAKLQQYTYQYYIQYCGIAAAANCNEMDITPPKYSKYETERW